MGDATSLLRLWICSRQGCDQSGSSGSRASLEPSSGTPPARDPSPRTSRSCDGGARRSTPVVTQVGGAKNRFGSDATRPSCASGRALIQTSKGPGRDSPLHMANIFPRTRKVGSPHAIFSVASGSAKQFYRRCLSGLRILGHARTPDRAPKCARTDRLAYVARSEVAQIRLIVHDEPPAARSATLSL